jgi:ribosomal protein L12E/L44/L45/RPP1/RPP2
MILNRTCIIAEDDVAKLLKDVGVNPEKEAITNMFKAMNGRKLHDLVKEGTPKLASVAVAAGKLIQFESI